MNALYAIGHSLVEAQRTTEAIKVFRVMIRLGAEDERGWLGLGLCHEESGEDDVASEIYGAGAAVASPPSPRCLLALARIRRRLGDRDLARECLETCVSLIEAGGHEELESIVHQELAS